MLNLDDTIAAIATPPGEGGIGVVRLSGPKAVPIAEALFQPANPVRLSQVRSHTLHYGRLVYAGDVLDEVLVAVMRKPHSYTREDVVEIQAHGSPVVLRAILAALVACGARHAEPGEFTQRAFLNGRLSLDQSQAVLDLIQAKTQLSARYALDRLEGKFSQPLQQVRQQLIELLAGVGVGMDYPEYEEDALPRNALEAGLHRAVETIERILERGKDGRILREGYRIAIVGRPNVGKSTLFNALLQTNRALVTPAAGTTRDTLEEFLDIQGVPFQLVDTAGLQTSDQEVEQLGMERTRAALSRADLALLLFDLSEALNEEDEKIFAELQAQPHLIVLNKTDLPQAQSPKTLIQKLNLNPNRTLTLSAQTGERLNALKDRLVRLVWGGQLPKHEEAFFLDAREKDLLLRGKQSLQQAQETAHNDGTLDLVAIEVQEALEVLGELTGESASESVIERIFSKFCVGK